MTRWNVIRAAASTCLLIMACRTGARSAEVDAPPRPQGVPAKAVWAGGLDGGAFILLSPAAPAGRYAGKIYDDNTGEVIFSGTLRVDSKASIPINVTPQDVRRLGRRYAVFDRRSIGTRSAVQWFSAGVRRGSGVMEGGTEGKVAHRADGGRRTRRSECAREERRHGGGAPAESRGGPRARMEGMAGAGRESSGARVGGQGSPTTYAHLV
jgi:hypothetical protein